MKLEISDKLEFKPKKDDDNQIKSIKLLGEFAEDSTWFENKLKPLT